MNPTSVFPSRRPVRAAGVAAVARTFPSLLVAAALSLPAAGSLRAQDPGSKDPAFNPSTVAATVYALLYEEFNNSVLDPRNTILAAGDIAYDENLHTDGTIRSDFVLPVFGSGGRIIFTAVRERFVSSGLSTPKVLLGGIFGQSASQVASKTTSQNITRIFVNGTQDTSFAVGDGANNYVTSILPLTSGKIVVGGLFTTFNFKPHLRIVRLNNDGSIDGSFNNSSAIDNDVLALAEGISPTTHAVDGTTLVAGTFNHVGGKAITKLARLDANGNLDSTFNPVIDSRVIAIAVQPTGKIIIGGEFTQVNGKAVSRIARLNYDGSLDTSFTTSVTGLPAGESNPVAVYVLSQLTNAASLGKIYVGGNFTQINGQTRRYLGLINPNGTVGAFNPGTTIYDKVQGIYVQPNGRVLVGETLGPKIGKNNVPTCIRLIGATTTN